MQCVICDTIPFATIDLCLQLMCIETNGKCEIKKKIGKCVKVLDIGVGICGSLLFVCLSHPGRISDDVTFLTLLLAIRITLDSIS
jgi:hypothetical protein